ncbi:MAG: hypothetical protein JKX72_01830 [Robiginitomaculum sp.]|nr:hypothetical protein [Robiginitomaculum sp.]
MLKLTLISVVVLLVFAASVFLYGIFFEPRPDYQSLLSADQTTDCPDIITLPDFSKPPGKSTFAYLSDIQLPAPHSGSGWVESGGEDSLIGDCTSSSINPVDIDDWTDAEVLREVAVEARLRAIRAWNCNDQKRYFSNALKALQISLSVGDIEQSLVDEQTLADLTAILERFNATRCDNYRGSCARFLTLYAHYLFQKGDDEQARSSYRHAFWLLNGDARALESVAPFVAMLERDFGSLQRAASYYAAAINLVGEDVCPLHLAMYLTALQDVLAKLPFEGGFGAPPFDGDLGVRHCALNVSARFGADTEDRISQMTSQCDVIDLTQMLVIRNFSRYRFSESMGSQ